jgi:hypothetical protein
LRAPRRTIFVKIRCAGHFLWRPGGAGHHENAFCGCDPPVEFPTWTGQGTSQPRVYSRVRLPREQKPKNRILPPLGAKYSLQIQYASCRGK